MLTFRIGIMVDLNKPADLLFKQHSSNVPKTTCCVMLDQVTAVTDSLADNCTEELKSSVSVLNVNYTKYINDYVLMCTQIVKVVKWFNQIDRIKISVIDIQPSCLINVLLHFSDLIKERIEVCNKSFTQNVVKAKN